MSARRWVWAGLAAGIVGNGLRLRDRLAKLAVLDDEPVAVETAWGRMAFITAAGVIVDDETRAQVVAHAQREGLRVVDLVPGDLLVEQALDLARQIDPATFRASRLTLGRGALHAIAVDVALVDRLDLPREEDLDVVEMTQAMVKAKQCAPTTTDLVIVPGLRAVSLPPEHRLAYARALAGTFAPVAVSMPIVQYALLVAGLAASPVAGAAAVLASAAQPWIATAGTALRPRDRTPHVAATRWLRQPRDAVWALRSHWEPAVEVAADPRTFARARPIYTELLAGGTDRFLEPRRDTCPWCDTKALEPLLEVGDLLQHKPGTFHLERCAACGHVFQNPRLTVEGLDFYYRDFYDGLAADEAEFLFAATDQAYRARAQMVARHVPSPDRWLDVGGGHGHFCLIAAEELPATRFDGLDMSESIDEAARRGWVTEGHRGMFPDLAEGLAGTYDVVSMHHYMEHTREPRAELDAARTALKPGGHLLIELPDPECAFGRIMGPLWGPWFQPQHQHFVSAHNLSVALRDAGFTIVEEQRGEAHQPADFSYFLWLLAQKIAPKPAKPWLPDPTPLQRAGRIATFGAFGPAFAVALVADAASAPLFRRTPNASNAFRILAQRAD